MQQEDFDLMIGRLDRILSEMVAQGKASKANMADYCPINRQTLKHHAEDMILAGQKILNDLECNPQKLKDLLGI